LFLYSINFQNSHQAYDSQRKLEVNTSYLHYDFDENNESVDGSERSSSVSKDQKSEKTLALKKHLLEKTQDMHHQSSRKMNQSQISGYRKTRIMNKSRSFIKQRDNSVLGNN